jgi:hypothetical protein
MVAIVNEAVLAADADKQRVTSAKSTVDVAFDVYHSAVARCIIYIFAHSSVTMTL